jgi:hypothetical protein
MKARTGLIAVVAASLLALAGCGDKSGGDGSGSGSGTGSTSTTPKKVEHTIDGVKSCLDQTKRFGSVDVLPPGKTDTSAYSAEQRNAVEQAAGDSTGGVLATSGGPQEHDGTISEIPFTHTMLLVYADEASASTAVSQIQPVAGDPTKSVVGGVRAVGPAVVVVSSFGIADAPGGAELNDESLKPVQDCLRAAGYL